MSGTSTTLPRDVKTWERAMAELGLTGQTIHGAELASAENSAWHQ